MEKYFEYYWFEQVYLDEQTLTLPETFAFNFHNGESILSLRIAIKEMLCYYKWKSQNSILSLF